MSSSPLNVPPGGVGFAAGGGTGLAGGGGGIIFAGGFWAVTGGGGLFGVFVSSFPRVNTTTTPTNTIIKTMIKAMEPFFMVLYVLMVNFYNYTMHSGESFMKKTLPNILVIAGPTASGKSELAVKLARERNGEVISCDSRQVYTGLNIGTGKVPGRWVTSKIDGRTHYMYKGVRHFCIDFVNPKKQYSVAEFKKDATDAIADILSRNKLPILCGGTGNFIDSVLFDQSIPEVPPNPTLRAKLEKKSADQLFAELKKKDSARAKSIDPFNKRRLIRALEIIYTTGKPVPKRKQKSLYTIEWIYLNPPRAELYEKIKKRLKQRLRYGMIQEVKELHAQGLSWKRMEDLGLEYRYVSRFLRGALTRQEMEAQLLSEIKHYAKRQETWFKRSTILAGAT